MATRLTCPTLPAHVRELMYKVDPPDVLRTVMRTDDDVPTPPKDVFVELTSYATMTMALLGNATNNPHIAQLFLCGPDLCACAHINMKHIFLSSRAIFDRMMSGNGLEQISDVMKWFVSSHASVLTDKKKLCHPIGPTRVVCGYYVHMELMFNDVAQTVVQMAAKTLRPSSRGMPACLQISHDRPRFVEPSGRDQAILQHAHCWMMSTIAEYESKLDRETHLTYRADYKLETEVLPDGSKAALLLESTASSRWSRLVGAIANLASDETGSDCYVRVSHNLSVLERAVAPRPPLPGTCVHCGNTDAMRFCKGCRKAVYCGEACAHAHWKAGHRKECLGL